MPTPYHYRDNRDDSDLRADAFAAAISNLLATQSNRDREALALLYDIDLELVRRVWIRLRPHEQQRLLTQAQTDRVIPEPLRSLLNGLS